MVIRGLSHSVQTEHLSLLSLSVNGTTNYQIAQSENLGLIQLIPHTPIITSSHSSEIYPEI